MIALSISSVSKIHILCDAARLVSLSVLLGVGPKHAQLWDSKFNLAHEYMKPGFQLNNTFYGSGQGYLLICLFRSI